MPPKQHAAVPSITLQHARDLRRASTPAERKLWSRLRAGRLNGLKFRRQHPIGPYIVDFLFERTRTAVELDGHTHGEQIEYGTARQAWLESCGYRVIRFSNKRCVGESGWCSGDDSSRVHS